MVKNCPVMYRVTPHAVPTPAITTRIVLSDPSRSFIFPIPLTKHQLPFLSSF
jgi:hypothetical protein